MSSPARRSFVVGAELIHRSYPLFCAGLSAARYLQVMAFNLGRIRGTLTGSRRFRRSFLTRSSSTAPYQLPAPTSSGGASLHSSQKIWISTFSRLTSTTSQFRSVKMLGEDSADFRFAGETPRTSQTTMHFIVLSSTFLKNPLSFD